MPRRGLLGNRVAASKRYSETDSQLRVQRCSIYAALFVRSSARVAHDAGMMRPPGRSVGKVRDNAGSALALEEQLGGSTKGAQPPLGLPLRRPEPSQSP